MIRCSSEENQRLQDTLGLDKVSVAMNATQVNDYLIQKNKFTKSKMQDAVMKEMFAYSFDIDDIEIVDDALMTSNYLHGKQLDKLYRKANSIIKSKGNPVDILKEIIIYSHRVVDAMADATVPASAQ